MARIRRPSLPTAISTLALLVALSGGAYALTIPRNSVGTPQLKADAVTSPKVKNRALTAIDVKAKTFEPDSTIVKLPFVSIALGAPDEQIARIGPFTLTGRCVTAGETAVQVIFETSANNSFFYVTWATGDADWDTDETYTGTLLHTPGQGQGSYLRKDARMATPSGWDVDLVMGATSKIFTTDDCEFRGYAVITGRP